MCGISCCITLHGTKPHALPEIEAQLAASLESIKHRGPDGSGTWISPNRRVALGHVRLSILDLSPLGSQPFHSPSGIHAVVNGELYSYASIRQDLESQASFNYTFQSTSDSELVLALYSHYGLRFLEFLRGEFSFVLWDEGEKLLVAGRDRYGIKPLFYTVHGGRLLVGAEIKAFLGWRWKAEWDVRSIRDGGWNFDGRSMFRGVSKVKPGHYLVSRNYGEVEERQYWEMSYPLKSLKDSRTEEELVLGVREHLVEAVRLRLRADVPVGVYLSGGIDSSAIAGIMTHLVRERGEAIGNDTETDRISCFSIAFDEDSGFDESAIAARTAEFLNVKYHKKHMSEQELASRFEEATWHCEHINADLNYVGKFALSELPRELGFKVVLTGEGADEHFAGYPMYLPDYLRELDPSWMVEDQVPESEREQLCKGKDKEAEDYYNSIGADGSNRTNPASILPRRILNNLTTPASMTAFSPSSLLSPWTANLGTCNSQVTIVNGLSGLARDNIANKWHPLHSAMYIWTKGHLANIFLSCLGDRTEMAHSLEARTPFLDHKLTEYVNDLPPSVKLRYRTDVEGKGEFVEKYILREAVKPFVTEEIYRRKKHPYSAPTTYPCNGPLHRLIHGLITKEAVEQLGFVDWMQVEGLVKRAFVQKEHLAMRFCFIVGQWIVLSRRFDVERAELDQWI